MPRDLSYGKVVERHSWTRWIWLVWAILATGTLAISTAILTTLISIDEHRSYSGVLQSKVQEVDLVLPKGLPLKEVLVQNGERVSAGQTLAVLDEDRLRILLAELEQNVWADNTLRKCLQTGDVPSQDTLEEGDVGADTRLKLDRVTKECQSIRERHEVQIRRILQAKRYLKEEHKRQIRRLKLAAQGVEDSAIQTRIAVQIAVELGSNTLKEGQMDLELSALRADHKKELVATLRALEQSVTKGRLRKAELEQALSSPRLYAPRSGGVSDRRDVQLGREYLQEILLLKISAAGTFEYISSFTIPRADATTLHIGDPVSVSVLGNQMDALQLKGAISDMEDTVDVGNGLSLVRIDVRLDEPSLALINSRSSTKQFYGRNSRSEIHFTMREIGLSGYLFRATSDLVAPRLDCEVSG